MMRRIKRSALAGLLAGATALVGAGLTAYASHTSGTYSIESPLGVTAWVSSPPRFHDGCGTYTTDYYDTPKYDDGTCGAAVAGNWAMDLAATSGSSGQGVYIDVTPKSFEGFGAGSTYRVVAGDSNNWNGGVGNDQYQYFGIHVWNAGTGSWENYAWIVLGHIDTLQYSSGTVICDSRTTGCTAFVAQIAPGSTYPAHVHLEAKDNVDSTSRISRSYNWDGPSNADDQTLSGPCNRTAASPSTCNAQVIYSDEVGYLGGTNTTFAELNNPYYPDF